MSSAHLLSATEALGLPLLASSWEGRPLHAGRLGPSDGPALVVVGGVHGDEPSGVAAVLELARALRAGAPARHPVWIVPALNPDGIARGTKNSARDVDLNRNFPARNFSTTCRPGYFPGEAPLSEPETAALAGLLRRVPLLGVIAVHAPLACVNYDGPAQAWAEAVGAACGWPAQADIGFPTPGSLGSWIGVDLGVPILTLELPAGPYEAFSVPARAALQTAINLEKLG
jgi:protein MpaA